MKLTLTILFVLFVLTAINVQTYYAFLKESQTVKQIATLRAELDKERLSTRNSKELMLTMSHLADQTIMDGEQPEIATLRWFKMTIDQELGLTTISEEELRRTHNASDNSDH